MKLLSTAQMRALDRHCIDDLGISGLELMERAGQAVAASAEMYLWMDSGPALILCGKGNNGGDGFVVAHALKTGGFDVRVVLPFAPDELAADAQVMYVRAVEAGVQITADVTDAELSGAAVVVDALLGTGVTGAVRGVMGELIERVNAQRAGRGVIAVDLPSGIDADTGKVYGPAIRAEVTVTIGLPKPGLLLHPGAEHAGRWKAVAIGYPPEVVAEWPSVGEVTERAQAAAWLPPRPPTAHKTSVGWALVIAGSFGMTGAAAMSTTSAYRSGAGLVLLALPKSLTPVMNAVLTEVVFRPLPETSAGSLSFRAVDQLLKEAEHVHGALIGCGLSRNAATQHAVRRFVPRWPGPLVVDADALTAMAGHDALWAQRTAPTIITPHPGEMSRLLGQPVAELEADRLATAKTAAQRFNAVTVFKGAPTVIAAPDGQAFVNPTGNPGLAVAGTGDTLAGAIVAMLAQRVEPLHAAVLATYLGGLAADRIANRQGIRGMTALDLIDELPYAMKEIIDETAREDEE